MAKKSFFEKFFIKNNFFNNFFSKSKKSGEKTIFGPKNRFLTKILIKTIKKKKI